MGGHSTRNYPNVVRLRLDAMLEELKKNGAKITGNNPWDIDTRQSGVKLRGAWSEATETLSVTLIDRDWYVPSATIWDTIESLMRKIDRTPDEDESAARG